MRKKTALFIKDMNGCRINFGMTVLLVIRFGDLYEL